jgi:hypothetical protein
MKQSTCQSTDPGLAINFPLVASVSSIPSVQQSRGPDTESGSFGIAPTDDFCALEQQQVELLGVETVRGGHVLLKQRPCFQ